MKTAEKRAAERERVGIPKTVTDFSSSLNVTKWSVHSGSLHVHDVVLLDSCQNAMFDRPERQRDMRQGKLAKYIRRFVG